MFAATILATQISTFAHFILILHFRFYIINLYNFSEGDFMKKIISVVLSVVLLCSVFSSFAFAADTFFTVNAEVRYGQSEARSMLSMINSFRTGGDAWQWNSDNSVKMFKTGLGTLRYDYELEKVAMQRAAEIALSFSHTRPNGKMCFSLISGYSYYGENLAAGTTTAESAFTLLQETDRDYSGQGHRRNMLDEGFDCVGIGHVIFNGCHYWTQEFGKSPASTEFTEPSDGVKSVPVSINPQNVVSFSVKPSAGVTSVHVSQSAEIPTVTLSLKLEDAWPDKSSSVSLSSDFTVSDSSVAQIKDGRIFALKAGSTTMNAEIMGEVIQLPLVVTDHEPVTDKAVFATCISTGLTEGSHCAVCGEILVAQKETQKENHKYDITDEYKSCTENCIITYTCRVCGAEEQKILPPINHENAYGTKGISATCTENGFTGGRYCPDCEEYISGHEIIKAEGHKPSVYSEMVPATCSEEGHTAVIRCSACGEILNKVEVIPKLSHSFKEYVYNDDATCTQDGTKTAKCEICGQEDTVTAENTAKGHTFIKYHFDLNATCTQNGTMTAKCEYCDATDVVTADDSKLNHSYEETLTKATLSKNGSIKSVCSRCGDIQKETVIAYPKIISLSASSFIYNRKVQKPAVTVKGSDSKIIPASYYTLTYSNASSKNSGTYTVNITFKGNYSGSKTLTYKITPQQVKGLKASAGATTVKLVWNKTEGAKYYKVEKSEDGKKWTSLSVIDKTSYTASKLTPGKKYQFRVSALDSSKGVPGAVSTALKTATLTKAPSVTLKAKSKSVTVSWKKVSGAAKYVVYKSSDGKKWTKVASTSKLSYTVTKLSAGRKIYIRVTALNAYSKESAPSAAKSVTVKK